MEIDKIDQFVLITDIDYYKSNNDFNFTRQVMDDLKKQIDSWRLPGLQAHFLSVKEDL